jgi:hypothetical protein
MGLYETSSFAAKVFGICLEKLKELKENLSNNRQSTLNLKYNLGIHTLEADLSYNTTGNTSIT